MAWWRNGWVEKVLQSVALALLSALVSYLFKRMLAGWGILDPLADGLGQVLKRSAPHEPVYWTVAALIGAGLYGFAVWGVWRPKTAATAPATATVSPSPLRLEVGESGDLFQTKSMGLYSTRRTLFVRVSNVAGAATIRDIRVHLRSITPATDYVGPWVLHEGFALAAGDYELIPLVAYGEALDPTTYNSADSFIQVGRGLHRPTLSINDGSTLALRGHRRGSPVRGS